MSPELKEAIKLIKSGHKQEGKEILLQILNENENNDVAWVWLTATVETDEMRLECLEEALKINPDNATAQRGYKKITQRIQRRQEQSLENIWDNQTEPELVTPAPTENASTTDTQTYQNYVQSYQENYGSQTAVSNSNRSPLTHSPWLTIFYAPRPTINSILQTKNPEQNVLLIVSAVGILSGLPIALILGLINPTYFVFGMLALLIIGPVFSILGLYIVAAIYSYIGFFLGGQGTARDVRVALAWSLIPRVAINILFIFQVIIIATSVPAIELLSGAPPQSTAITNALSCVQFLTGLWILYIYLESLGAAHRFSAGRAFITILMPGIILGVFFCGLVFLLAVTS